LQDLLESTHVDILLNHFEQIASKINSSIIGWIIEDGSPPRKVYVKVQFEIEQTDHIYVEIYGPLAQIFNQLAMRWVRDLCYTGAKV